jgi:hypothetical protein
MSRLLITIDTDNDAFQDEGWRQEAANVLTRLAAELVTHGERYETGALRDTNGNTCGCWDYNADEPES